MAVKPPRSTKAATTLLERYAALEGAIAGIEEKRALAIAAANTAADAVATPLLEEQDAIREKLGTWWWAASEQLTEGKRKSIELGGCTIGSREGRSSLDLAGKDAEAIKALRAAAWGAPFVRVTYSIDKAAVAKALDGAHAKQLAKLGFSIARAPEIFFVQRAEQAGTLAGASK